MVLVSVLSGCGRARGGDESRQSLADEVFRERTALVRVDSGGVEIACEPTEAKLVRLVIRSAVRGQACLDELEVMAVGSLENIALSGKGAKASASSVLPGYAIHQVAHLNDGLYGNEHSWIAATNGEEWAQIELAAPATIDRVVISRDRNGKFNDRQVMEADVRVSMDGQQWKTVGRLHRTAADLIDHGSLALRVSDLRTRDWDGMLDYAFRHERATWNRIDAGDALSPLRRDRPCEPGGPPYWGRLVRLSPLDRVLAQFEEMIERSAKLGLAVENERRELTGLRARSNNGKDADALYQDARLAKRRLFFRDPRLAPLQQVLFAKRHPYKSSHNYSEHLDSLFAPGGGIFALKIPQDGDGRLDPAHATETMLFDGRDGIARDPAADFDARTIYFAYRPDKPDVEGWKSYWHMMRVNADGGGLRKLTDGPFHDFDPVPLPDGGLGFLTTRCISRFLCWEPQAYVLHRMEADGSGMRRLSFANLSEWDPTVMRDGRILWTRSEYLDKGSDFGHTLWAIGPDGTRPELVFGNDTPYGYGHAREVPDSREIVCTLISHGDHQGPIALIDPSLGPYETAALTNITPDTRPQYQMDRSYSETFGDPSPVSRDHFLVSHNPGPGDHWCLYVIDRYGNRELLYADPLISSKNPTLLGPHPKPPVPHGSFDNDLAAKGLGQFVVGDVYNGLGSAVPRGRARYLAVSQELAAPLEHLPDGEYRNSHPPFQDFYATPIHLVHGPAHDYLTRMANALDPHAFRAGAATAMDSGLVKITERGGWPGYVAKAPLGTARIADDGSVSFTAPAGRVLYFHLLDHNFNELQRMRSVIQLQPGECRSCVGCHDPRGAAPVVTRPAAALSMQSLQPPPWGEGPFDFQRVVQPVLDASCIRCHDGDAGAKPDLTVKPDSSGIPASYRSLVSGGSVHYFDMTYGARHFLAEPMSFGTLHSPLFQTLTDERHRDVKLATNDLRAIKTWIDLNCPLWGDYRYRPERLKQAGMTGAQGR